MSQRLPHGFFIPDPEQGSAPRNVRRRPGIRTVLWTLLLLIAVAVILYAGVFRIRTVTVVGNRRFSWGDVVKAAGLEGGVSYFAVNEDKIKTALETNSYLAYEGLEKSFPSSLTLYVRERTARANMKSMGVIYLIDETGRVLERMPNNQLREDLPIVTGLQPIEATPGRDLVPRTADQLTYYTELMQEMVLQGYWGEVSELILTDPDSLCLITRNGYTIRLGDHENLRAKLGTVRGVTAKLAEMGEYGGVIEASTPEVAVYSPATE